MEIQDCDAALGVNVWLRRLGHSASDWMVTGSNPVVDGVMSLLGP